MCGRRGPLRWGRLFAWIVAVLALVACSPKRPDRVPGETDVRVDKVVIQTREGEAPTLEHEVLYLRLAMRAKNPIFAGRTWSPFREAEDKRRIFYWWQSFGFFDVEVDPPKVEMSADKTSAKITWTIREGPRYAIASVHVENAPEGETEGLRDLVPFAPGDTSLDFETFRKVRHAMGERLRRRGWGHATIYSRSYVDRTKKAVDWYYFVDAGPKTKVGTIRVEGNHKVPAAVVLERVGMAVGDDYDLEKKERAELALLDTGAFASAYIETNADVEFLIPGETPDTGGQLSDAQIDAEGHLVPRKLNDNLDLVVRVVESPSQQVRVRAGLEADPARIDTYLGSDATLRHLFGPQHHLVLEGRIGYGWLWRGDTRDPTGVYGEALARYVHPGFIGRTLDFRLTTRYRDDLYPGYHLREIVVGPGVRQPLAKGVFFDLDAYFRWATSVDYGPFDAATRARLDIPADDRSYGADLEASITWDARNSITEPTEGHLLALRTNASPGKPLATHGWWLLGPEARKLFPVTPALSLGLRASAAWVLLAGEDGLPLGPRLFGGGAFGMRGFGRQELSPRADCTAPPGRPLPCRDIPVGGESLFESTAELRWLPPRKPYGAATFVDFGGAGAEANPFEEGVALALGVGLRVRLWYLPISFDVAYRLLNESEIEKPDSFDPFLAFVRIGEAF